MLLRQLMEQANSPSQVIETLIAAIKRADFFLNDMGGITKPLYRGLESYIPLVKVRAPRQDRQPKDTIPTLHHKLDGLLERDFGVKYRSSSIFATANRNVAREYGLAYFLLPLGDFKFCWSPVSDDALNFFGLRHFLAMVEQDGSEAAKSKYKSEGISSRHWAPEAATGITRKFLEANDPDIAPLFNAWVEDKYKEANYQEGNYEAAHKSGHELMIYCQEVAIIDIDPIAEEYAQELDRVFGTTKFSDPLLSMAGVIAEINRLVNGR